MPRLSKVGAAALAAFGWTGISSVTATYLVVAGGAAGASGGGGGGGAGGLLTGTATLNPTLSYTVTVGAGGAVDKGAGGNSSFGSIVTATGGGGGGSNGSAGTAGGSGGGGGAVSGSAGGAGTSGQGNNGGSGSNNGGGSISNSGGGGGGAGAVGGNGSGSSAGSGGAGSSSSISGTATFYAGGGGGGWDPRGGGGPGAGGSGGGGAGGNPGVAGTANTGGGGGAGKFDASSAAGGSGVVIISYAGAQQFGGGNVTSVGGNTIHTFTTSGTLVPATPLTAQYLIVAGGGGGGSAWTGGGGGAGGMLTGTGVTIDTNSNYVVAVGAGGTAATSGSNSSWSMVSTAAVGGGYGITDNSSSPGGNGGSGGGSGYNVTSGGGTGTSGQGNNGGGGSGWDGGAGTVSGGGGGGKSAAGANGVFNAGGAGGAGAASSISGTSVTYAGGGGGGSGGGSAGAGGAGGGGAGALGSNASGTAGTANTGGGGGGAAKTSGTGGTGGSGVVIIAYPGSTQQMAGGTVTISGGNVIHTFTSSGYLTPIKYASRSLRFRASNSAYLSRTTTASVTNNKIFTYSMWVKRGIINDPSVFETLIGGGPTNADTFGFGSGTNSAGDYLHIRDSAVGSYNLLTTQLFRDPSAWYHFVLAVDTTQATASNRVKLYVNGVQVTSFSSASYPAQNYVFDWNTTSTAYVLGRRSGGNASWYFDGYMTEVNAVDGQQLTPSSFGTFNSFGVWQPITYGGSYGTNGFYLPFNVGTSSYAGIFNGSSKSLSGTLASAVGSGNLTIEAWVNQSTLTNYQNWFSITRGAGGFNIGTDASGTLVWYSGGARQIAVSSVIKTSQWQHVAFVRSGTTVTAYLNGISQGTATVSTNFSSTGFFIGSLDNTQEWENGAISNLRLTNTAVYTSNFVPSTSPLTAVTGTILLTLQNSTFIDNSGNSTAISNTGTTTSQEAYPFVLNIAADYSPQGNNWTTNNISLTAGVTYDSMTDVPTLTSATVANYAVLNPLNLNGAQSITNGNLLVTNNSGPGNTNGAYATIAIFSGKWYCESTITAIGNNAAWVGLHQNLVTTTTEVYSGSWAYKNNGNKSDNSSVGVAYGSSYTTGDVIGVAVDADAGSITFYKNNVSQGVAYSSLTMSGGVIFVFGGDKNNVQAINFGQQGFVYTPPSGFVALNTYNLSTPTIPNGAVYMAATLYTGTGASLTIANTVNGTSFQPDFVWIKKRSAAASHTLFDVNRGATIYLSSDSTSAEATAVNSLTAFNSNGFTLGNGSGVNTNDSGATYVGWQWKANGTGVSNTSGTITSTVSAGATAGFSVVTYTGTGANATVGHGLGVAPSMMIFKNRTGVYNWAVYHASLANASTTLELNNTTAADGTNGTTFNATAPTSSVFSLGTNDRVNRSTNTFVAYVFAAVAGYSAFGSYTGNGSSDGPFVYTGFRPRFVMIKSADTAVSWYMHDSVRNTYNQVDLRLIANGNNTEASEQPRDFLSNGFKIRTSDSGTNGSGTTYIYAAFAENPFKYSNAR